MADEFKYKLDYSNVPDYINPSKNTKGRFGNDAQFWEANIVNSFLGFGYEPTKEEVQSLIPTSAGEGGYQRGQAAVADYVRAQKAAQERVANDPLNAVRDEERGRASSLETQSGDLFQQALNIYKAAPQLFGGLQPDQIQQYLAPLQEQFKTGLAGVEGAFGRRNLAGSSIEANSLAEQQRLYQQNVLATGLQLGLDQQTNQANLLSNRSSTLFSGAEGSRGRLLSGTGQLSSQAYDESQFLASLPVYLRQLAMQERAMQEASSGTDWGSIGQLAGTVLGGTIGAFGGPGGAAIGAGLGGQLGGGIGNAATGKYGAAAGNVSSIPLWMLMGNRSTPTTTGTTSTTGNPSDIAYNSLLRTNQPNLSLLRG
jgi:hypothetical protein